jgi:hypothetical protein
MSGDPEMEDFMIDWICGSNEGDKIFQQNFCINPDSKRPFV